VDHVQEEGLAKELMVVEQVRRAPQDPLDPPDHKDHLEHLAQEVLKEELDPLVQGELKGQQVHGEPSVYQDHQEPMEMTEILARMENRVHQGHLDQLD